MNQDSIDILYGTVTTSNAGDADDALRRSRVVNTYFKLDPRELLFYFENLSNYPRRRLITDVHIRHPTFPRDQESLQAAIRSALDERPWLDGLPSLPTESAGGILDFGDGRDNERQAFGADGSFDGSLPPPASYRPPHSEYSPRGDDGSVLDEDEYDEGDGGGMRTLRSGTGRFAHWW